MYRIHQIKLNLDEDKNAIPVKIAKKIGGRGLVIKKMGSMQRIHRRQK